MTDRLFVLARRRSEGAAFIREKRLKPADCTVITCTCELRGQRGFRFVMATYPGEAIMALATARGIEVHRRDVETAPK